MVDSTAVPIFVVILVELTNTVFVHSTNTSSNIETAVLSSYCLKTNVENRFSLIILLMTFSTQAKIQSHTFIILISLFND